MIYRRFGFVQSRLLLDKQYELQDLEKTLEEMDKDEEEAVPGSLKMGELDFGSPSQRKRLMKDLEAKYNEYGKFSILAKILKLSVSTAKLITSAKELTSSSRPSEAAYKSFHNFFAYARPLCQEDESWIECKEDMLTLRNGREYAWLDVIIEHLLKMFNCRFIEVCIQGT